MTRAAPLARIQCRSGSWGILAGMADVMKVATAGMGAQIAWPALLRKVERLDPGYKT